MPSLRYSNVPVRQDKMNRGKPNRIKEENARL